MAFVNGRVQSKADLLRRVGNLSQLARVRPFVYRDGKADGIRAFDVATGGGLEFTVLEGKCLDLMDFRYKGQNLNFVSKPGLVSPTLAEHEGRLFLRSVPGGMLYTCGLSNVGPACTDEGAEHRFHGRIRNIPAEKTAVLTRWDDDECTLGVSGEMRDAGLFLDDLVLRRTIRTRLGARSVEIHDIVENEGFEEQALMLMYHINVGYPLLDEGSRLVLPRGDVTPGNPAAAADLARFAIYSAPVDHAEEQIFFHRPSSDPSGATAAAVVNDALGLGFYVKFDRNELPNLIEWKSMGSGDYVAGIEPANCLCNGRLDEKMRGTLQRIAPGEKREFHLEIGVLDGAAEIAAFEALSASRTGKGAP